MINSTGDGHDSITHYGESYRGVTINAGAGDDIIRSNSIVGAVFQIASVDGSDVIYGFTEKDTIQTHSRMTYSRQSVGNDTKITIGSARITLKNFKSRPNVYGGLPVKTSGYSSNIAGSNGAVSSLWFTEDDNNFISGETKIDSVSEVTADNYSVGKICATNFENLAQDENIIAYSKK